MKTSELQGAALDWAVAKCEGRPHSYAVTDVKGQTPFTAVAFTPSTDWALGGPIVERERISPTYCRSTADWQAAYHIGRSHLQTGPTPLIAAMRCFVASQLGDEIDVPKEIK